MTLLVLLGCATVAASQPSGKESEKESVEYWRKQYQELRRAEDPRAESAHIIFQRLVQVAGTRSGVVPRLLIVARNPWDRVLPIALRDGWIVLSPRVLDICYEEKALGDDRLAFVLGHEIAHLLYDDHFWHLTSFTGKSSMPPASVSNSELRADKWGILYAAMAGYNTRAIVTKDGRVDFFTQWVRALERIGGVPVGDISPLPQDRAELLRGDLRQIAEKTAVFQAGLWFSYAGDYPQAIQAFEHFRTVFPSSEVIHNLAASHHRLALQAYQAWKRGEPALPWQLSLALDPLTRASRIYLDGPTRGGTTTLASPEARFRDNLDAALALYRAAFKQDEAYTPAALNLGCALIIHGLHATAADPQADFAEAVMTLRRALKHVSNALETTALLNNLGVASWYAEQPHRARESLVEASTLAPAYAAPVFNLAHLERVTGQEAKAQDYQRQYAQLVPASVPACPLSGERILGLGVGDPLPAQWQASTQSTVPLEGKSMTMATYRNGVMTLSRGIEIQMLMVREGYQGTSTCGIKIGSEANDVLKHYGVPSRRMELTSGQSWAYDDRRIAFQLHGGRVVSWLVF